MLRFCVLSMISGIFTERLWNTELTKRENKWAVRSN